MIEKGYMRRVYKACKPKDATRVMASRKSCNCCYDDGEETVLIIHANIVEFNGKDVLCIGFIKTGHLFRGYGICRDFLKDLVKECDYTIMLADIVSKPLFELINKHFECEKIGFTLGDEDINKNWEHYSDMYGSYIIKNKI